VQLGCSFRPVAENELQAAALYNEVQDALHNELQAALHNKLQATLHN